MIKNRTAATASSFLVMFFLGVGTAVIGAASKNIGLNPSQIGLLIMVQNIGFLFSVVVSGSLADSMKKPVLLSIASFVLAAAFFFFYFRSSFILNFFIMLVIGIGMGAYEGTADPFLLDIHTKRESLYITINHFFVTFGELMITVYLIFLQMHWRRSVIEAAAAVAVLGILFLFIRAPKQRAHIEKLSDRVLYVRKEKGVVLLFLLALCAVGSELGLIGILTSFLVDFRGFTLVTSKLGMVTFLAGVACGRLVLGFIAKKEYLVRYIMVLFSLSVLGTAALFFIPGGAVFTYILLFFLGTVISVNFPLIISLGGIKYPEASGTVLGLVKLGIPIGGIVMPFLLSLLSNWWSFSGALLLFPLFGVIGLVLLAAGRKRLRIE